jgi:hypothetical protein
MFGSNVIGRSALAATALAALTIGAGAARAEVVCNPAGDCWHVHRHETYPEPGYAYHPDDWYFHRSWGGGQYRWHDYHPGRGYWRNGVWVTF